MTNSDAATTASATAVAEQGAHVAPERASSKKGASQKKNASKGQKTAKGAKPKKETKLAKKAPKPGAERTNKKAEVIALMKRVKGVTLAEIMEATGWQKHTVRGFVSVIVSKGGEKIESSKNAAGQRTYKIAK